MPYSHDEVVHGKKSMVDKMTGGLLAENLQRCGRCMDIMFAHPGKKLMFMGDDFAQFIEWDEKHAAGLVLVGI